MRRRAPLPRRPLRDARRRLDALRVARAGPSPTLWDMGEYDGAGPGGCDVMRVTAAAAVHLRPLIAGLRARLHWHERGAPPAPAPEPGSGAAVLAGLDLAALAGVWGASRAARAAARDATDYARAAIFGHAVDDPRDVLTPHRRWLYAGRALGELAALRVACDVALAGSPAPPRAS